MQGQCSCLACQLSYAYPCQNTTEASYRKWKAPDPARLQNKHLGQEHQHWLPCRMQCALSSFVFTAYIKCRSSTWLTRSPAHCFVQIIPLAVKVTQAERGKRCCNADTTIPRSILNYAYDTVSPGSIQARDQHHSHSQPPVPRISCNLRYWPDRVRRSQSLRAARDRTIRPRDRTIPVPPTFFPSSTSLLLLFCSSLAAWQFLSSIHLIFFFSLCFVFLSNPHCYHHRCALSFAHNPPYPHVILRYSLYLPCPWLRPCLCRYRRLND